LSGVWISVQSLLIDARRLASVSDDQTGWPLRVIVKSRSENRSAAACQAQSVSLPSGCRASIGNSTSGSVPAELTIANSAPSSTSPEVGS
jgi:hypothetical protein